MLTLRPFQKRGNCRLALARPLLVSEVSSKRTIEGYAYKRLNLHKLGGCRTDGQMTATNLDHISGPVMRLDIIWFVSEGIRITGVRCPEIYGRANQSSVFACAFMWIRLK